MRIVSWDASSLAVCQRFDSFNRFQLCYTKASTLQRTFFLTLPVYVDSGCERPGSSPQAFCFSSVLTAHSCCWMSRRHNVMISWRHRERPDGRKATFTPFSYLAGAALQNGGVRGCTTWVRYRI